jgi:HEAT repeat protein
MNKGVGRYNVLMRVAVLVFAAPLAAVLCPSAFGYARSAEGTENIPQLIADSTLVCKGEVVSAPPIQVVSEISPPHLTASATVHIDRCFKGPTPPNESVSVLFDGLMGAPAPYMVLRNGDYRLFFLKPQQDKYVVVDQWFGQLTVSRLLAPVVEDSDPMHLLELDLKAGLNDTEPDRVLDSIRMLGNMRHLQSKDELLALVNSPDELVRIYTYEALLRLHDYSVLPAVADWLEVQPAATDLVKMQGRLLDQIMFIRDPTALPPLLRLLRLPDASSREHVLQAVRHIPSPQSAQSMLNMLDDPDVDNEFIAMQALLEYALVGGRAAAGTEWVPTWRVFRDDPTYYAARCREWWQSRSVTK